MDPIGSTKLRWLHGALHDVTYELERSQIDLTVEPRRVLIRGARALPEPTHAEGRAVRLLAMEIDYGPFEREVALPAEVEIDQASAEQRNGLLWISLPLKQ